ncbi:MAG: UbiA family prenyltransferase [Thermoplasmata archaeon]
MNAKAYLRIIRPTNCVIAGVAVAIAGLVAVGPSIYEYAKLLDLMLAGLVAFLFVAAGNTLNDYYDHEVDRINHPGRPIPSGLIHRDNALTFAIILFVPTVFLGLLINLESFLVVLVSAAVMINYERTLKRRGFLGNLQIGWLVASLFLLGGFAVHDGRTEAIVRVAALAVLSFLATLGREITKDIEDVKGDQDRTTLPKSMGLEKSANLARLFYATAIGFSLLLFFLGVFGYFYLGSVLLADAVFLVSMLVILINPTLASNLSKAAMILALAAFLLGALLA